MNATLKTHAQEIKANITSKPAWAERAILALYEKQTSDEQHAQDTKYNNKQGFTSSDAALLSSFAQQLKRGNHLSERQLPWAYKKLAKYAAQLARIAAEKRAA